MTGGTGFLGSAILRALWEAGYTSLHSVSRGFRVPFLPEAISRNIRWHNADLADGGALEDVLTGVSRVVHAAGPSPFSPNYNKHQVKLLQQGTENLVNLSLEHGVTHFVHISSIAALGIRKKQEQITEEHIFSHSRFDSPFGLAKFVAEQTVWRAHAEGLPVSVLNPGYVLGVGDRQYSSPVLWSWLAGKPMFYPVGQTGWVGSEDVAKAVVNVLTGDFTGQRTILCSENLTFQDIFGRISDEVGVARPGIAFRRMAGLLLPALRRLHPRMVARRFFFYDFLGENLFADASYSSDLSIRRLGQQYRPIQDAISEVSALSAKIK